MGEAVKVEAFIPDWPGLKQHADDIANVLYPLYPTHILNDPTEYFNAQWARARSMFTGDILLWVMADAGLPSNFPEMCTEMERVMARGDVGWYAPDIEWTSFIFDKSTLPEVEPGIFEVPNTDSVCFAIRGDVVRTMPHIDPNLCFMWGMDFTAILTAHLMGLKIVRDYRFKIQHPNDTGYDIHRASAEMKKLFEGTSFTPSFKAEMVKWIAKTNRLKVQP
jgi:hypothetical protein